MALKEQGLLIDGGTLEGSVLRQKMTANRTSNKEGNYEDYGDKSWHSQWQCVTMTKDGEKIWEHTC